MRGTPSTFWAKLTQDESGNVLAWHPLADHCADVGACCEVLLGEPVLRRRLARLGGLETLTDAQADRLCVLAALHDVGKFNLGFQAKARLGAAVTAGHVGEVLALFGSERPEAGRLADSLGFETLCGWARPGDDEAGARLLIASIAHHGRPMPLSQNPRAGLWAVADGLDPFAGIASLSDVVRRWFPRAFEQGGPPLPARAAFQHAFSGLVTLADWLGSDESLFLFSSEADGDRMTWSRAKAASAAARIGLATAPSRRSFGEKRPNFSQVSEFPARDAQAKVLALPQDARGDITVLESETGSGKTEAALARFLVLFQAGEVDGLYFALPTRTAATQIHRRVVEAVARAFPEPGSRPPVVLAVPGYIAVDDRVGTLAGFRVLWPDDDQRHRHRGWAAEHPKRYLAGQVVVGTIDQVLLSTLMVSHSHLRATALLRHLLVVDEVHASDAYMTRILEAVLARHRDAGGHALLMSATLGAVSRQRLLSPNSPSKLVSLAEATATPYPLITHRPADSDPRLVPVTAPEKSKAVDVELRPLSGDPNAVAGLALELAARGARVLVLRNTVKDCVETQVALERAATALGRSALLFGCGGVPAPHHARFARDDRFALDEALERSFGKCSSPGGCVVVATQTVQQSLDIDADRLITDLCPMDVLLQRLGRVHRHADRVRHPDFTRALADVLTPAQRDLAPLIRRDGTVRGPHGIGTVYEDLRILEATWRILEREGRLIVPDMSRALVEATTHPEALAQVVGEKAGAWRDHAGRMLGSVLARSQLADLNLANWSAPFGDVESLFPSHEMSRVIQTRLGEGDRIAELDRALRSPFGATVRAFTIPAHFSRAVPADATPTEITATDSTIEFSLGAARFRYDRLGLRPAPVPSTPQEDDLVDA